MKDNQRPRSMVAGPGLFSESSLVGSRAAVFLMVGALACGSVMGQRFLPDDPLWNDPDTVTIPRPADSELGKIYDFIEKYYLVERQPPFVAAANVNTLGEVPDSTWFTNRAGRREMTLEELARGPDRIDGPDVSGPLTITSGKEGVTPGFVLRDQRGEVFFVKVDPIDYPEMASAAEVIVTKFFHAFGYNVPENYIAHIRADQLRIADDAKVEGETGKQALMTPDRLRDLLALTPRRPDGSIRIMASRRLPGQPVGPFNYLGSRTDDANDLFPHEDMRELRGLRVFCSWLNHNDSDSANTLDVYLKQDEGGYLKHYLIDFGTTLGSGAVVPHVRRAGHEYFVEWKPALRSLFTLGILDRPWQRLDGVLYPSIGRFGVELFDPAGWRPDYPNPAFLRMTRADAFWAARIVQRFDDQMVRAIVQTGEISDPKAEDHLVGILIRRRDLIVRHWLGEVNPLSDFETADGLLRFQNLGLVAGLARQADYQYRWHVFDNDAETAEPLHDWRSSKEPAIPLPENRAEYWMISLKTLAEGRPKWEETVKVYLRTSPQPTVVGVQRLD